MTSRRPGVLRLAQIGYMTAGSDHVESGTKDSPTAGKAARRRDAYAATRTAADRQRIEHQRPRKSRSRAKRRRDFRRSPGARGRINQPCAEQH